MIRVDSLTKVFSAKSGPAIDHVSFDVSDGEIVGFVGLNGAGKTTTIRAAAGVSIPTSGTVSIDGFDIVTQKVEASARLGWVPELPNYEGNSTAISLMEYFAGFMRMPGSEARARSMGLLKQVGLEGAETKKVGAYSQGMKKRFALASAMLGSPKNYLFDEILNGLDPEGIRYLRNLMTSLRSQGSAILLSSHILVEVEGVADRVVFIHRGKVIKSITRNELSAVSTTGIRLVIRNIDDRAVDYLKSLGNVNRNGDVLVLSSKADPAKVNSELLKMGYEVTEFASQKEGLEDYFLDLIEGSK